VHSLHFRPSLITKPIRPPAYRLYYICEHLSLIWHEIASAPESSQSVIPRADDSCECDMTNAHLSGPITAPVSALAVRHPVTSIGIAAGIKPTTIRCPSLLHCVVRPGARRPLEHCCPDGESRQRRRYDDYNYIMKIPNPVHRGKGIQGAVFWMPDVSYPNIFVNLRLIFSTLPMLPSHVSSPRLRITF